MAEIGAVVGKLSFAILSDYLLSNKLVRKFLCSKEQTLAHCLSNPGDEKRLVSQGTSTASPICASRSLLPSLLLSDHTRLNQSKTSSFQFLRLTFYSVIFHCVIAMGDVGAVCIWFLCWWSIGYVRSVSHGECASCTFSHFTWHWRLPRTTGSRSHTHTTHTHRCMDMHTALEVTLGLTFTALLDSCAMLSICGFMTKLNTVKP